MPTPVITVTDSQDGGGFVSAVTGTDPAAVNTFYYQRGTAGAWAVSGVRTGDGSVPGALAPDYYWFRCDSLSGGVLTMSNLVWVNLTDSAASAHEQLQDAVVARLRLAGLPGMQSGNVCRVKFPYDNDGAALKLVNLPGTPPWCLVTTFRQLERYPGGTNGHDDTVLPVLLLFVTKDLTEPVSDDRVTLWRQYARRALRMPFKLAGAACFFADILPGQVFDIGVTGTDVQVSPMAFQYKVREPRLNLAG